MNKLITQLPIFLFLLGSVAQLTAQSDALLRRENEYYRIQTLRVDPKISMEVGGMCALPDGRIAACTRRGDLWIIENPEMTDNVNPRYTLFAEGLHEPLGMAYHDHSILVVQRGEITRITDEDGDERADRFETIYDWPLTGNYHEYSYGPKFLPDGSMIITTNVAFPGAKSHVPWRGWALQISPDGTMSPWACGLRSPCGTGIFEGELFYTDNQGGWVGSGGLWHLPKGSFAGQPESLKWTSLEGSPVSLTSEQFYDVLAEHNISVVDTLNGKPRKSEHTLRYELEADMPELQNPAVWLPHGILGISNSEILVDRTGGSFGPFEGQLFIGDQGQSKIMRVALEKVKGEYQGVAFDFRAGFQSGVLRMIWAQDATMYVGQTNRGWGSAGNEDEGIQRLTWSGKTPFEMKTVEAMPDGFELIFTKPVDRASAEDLDSYSGRSFLYKYHKVYGSPPINHEDLSIKGVKVSEDGLKVRLVIDNLRKFYIHELQVSGVKAEEDQRTLLHPVAYYTLRNIPDGSKLPLSELSQKSSSKIKAAEELAKQKRTPTQQTTVARAPSTAKPQSATVPTYEQVEGLLSMHTCIACHRTNKKLIGPSFQDIAKRNYSPEKIVQLIYSPVPSNWPEYPTAMAPMPHVPRKDALQIARWINSLR